MSDNMLTNCDKKDMSQGSSAAVRGLQTNCSQEPRPISDSIEKLQQILEDLQIQLDKATDDSKELSYRSELSLNSKNRSIQDKSNLSFSLGQSDDNLGDDEDELLEFQMVENELRITELRKHMESCQEDLRIKLYRRLVLNTSEMSSDEKLTSNRIESDCSIKATESSIKPCASREDTRSSTRDNVTSPITSESSFSGHSSRRIYSEINDYPPAINYRNSSTSSDLERIEEAQDETIDEIDPAIDTQLYQLYGNGKGLNSIYETHGQPSRTSDSSAFIENSCRKTSNRPLTMYLPKPDSNINLLEHIQSLGHDCGVLADEIELDSDSAKGYLWKCSSNNRKWLRRFFNFDRRSHTITYHVNKASFLKETCAPKSCIKFDEISDVYMDHKLSEISSRDRSMKKRNFVFVLSTIRRKYLLATSRAEIMRAWIEIIYTAASPEEHLLACTTQD